MLELVVCCLILSQETKHRQPPRPHRRTLLAMAFLLDDCTASSSLYDSRVSPSTVTAVGTPPSVTRAALATTFICNGCHASFLMHAHTPPASSVIVRGGIDFFPVTLLWCTLKVLLRFE